MIIDPTIGHNLLQTGVIDLVLLILGFAVGQLTRLRTPILFMIFLVQVVKWWFETHPHGREVAQKTKFDEEFRTRFSKEIAEVEKIFSSIDASAK